MDTHLVNAEGVTYALKASGGAGWEQHRERRAICDDCGAALIV